MSEAESETEVVDALIDDSTPNVTDTSPSAPRVPSLGVEVEGGVAAHEATIRRGLDQVTQVVAS